MNQTISKAIACFLLSVWFVPTMIAQDWEHEKTVDGIEIFTRAVPGEDLLELKIEFTLATRLGPLVALLDDVESYTEWVYKATKFEQVLSTGDGEGIFYGQVDFPWPMDDRDYVITCTTEQDPHTKVVTLESRTCEHQLREVSKDFIRVPSHFNRWELHPISSNEVRCIYLLKSDPGGSIPKWLINLAIDKGAVETIQNLRERISSCEQNTRLAYIQEK